MASIAGRKVIQRTNATRAALALAIPRVFMGTTGVGANDMNPTNVVAEVKKAGKKTFFKATWIDS
jgi:hypothetical protein